MLDGEDRVLGSLDAEQAAQPDAVRELLRAHVCAPRSARDVLAAGLAAAKASRRHAFVYLSAPW